MKIRWKKFSHLKRYQIFSYRLIPNTENQKKTLIMRKQQPFRGLRKKQIEKNYSYLLTKWRTKIKFLSLHEILFWLQLASYKHCQKSQSEDPLDLPKSLGGHWKLDNFIMVLFCIVQSLLHPVLGFVMQFIE